jgi:hypothetical protein
MFIKPLLIATSATEGVVVEYPAVQIGSTNNGTSGFIPVWTGSNTIGNSLMGQQNGTITLSGSLLVMGSISLSSGPLEGTSGYSGYSGYSGINGEGVVETITYNNSFAAGDVLKKTSGGYAKAQADTAANAEVVGIVQSATGAAFTIVYTGPITGFTGLTDGTVYFLSDSVAGAITATPPTALNAINKPVLVATSTTGGVIVHMRGVQNGNQVSTFLTSVPATTATAGSSGQWAVDSTHFYVYDTSTSPWRRAGISTF